MRLRIATYNIHGGVGGDGRLDFDRILRVLLALDCDLVALQEVVASGGRRGGLLARLAEGTGSTAIAGPALIRETGPYGNALLTRLPVQSIERIDLTVPNREPRGALVVQHALGDSVVQVIATHLGLSPAERREQIRRLLGRTGRHAGTLSILMGDINEWFLWGRPLRWLHARYGKAAALPSFPARFPVLALDRIWVHPSEALASVRRHNTALARAASDHLPIVAELEWPAAARAPGDESGERP